MNHRMLINWISRKVSIDTRLRKVVLNVLIFYMISTRKHSLCELARLTNSTTSRYSKFLKNHSDLAIKTLNDLSKKESRQFGKHLELSGSGKLPWRISILIDATLQARSSLHVENSKRFNHGKGYVIGHQWTNIVLCFNDSLIPLEPIPFYSKNYCKKNNIKYKTEHDRLIEYIEKLDLNEYFDQYDPNEVVVLGDSGYDNKKIENIIAKKGWKYVIALKKTRSVKSEKEFAKTPKSKGWTQIEMFFKKHRWIKWTTVFMPKNSARKKRMEFRIRHITGYLRYVGKVRLICSVFKKRPKGRRKYLTSNDLKASPRHILLAYRIRWDIEIFHKKIKMFLGFEDVATWSFTSVISHVHWVYCAYILMNKNLPGIPQNTKSIAEKQKYFMSAIERTQISGFRQILSQINGAERLNNEFRRVLNSPLNTQLFNMIGIS